MAACRTRVARASATTTPLSASPAMAIEMIQ
jgi:hypothetical protein